MFSVKCDPTCSNSVSKARLSTFSSKPFFTLHLLHPSLPIPLPTLNNSALLTTSSHPISLLNPRTFSDFPGEKKDIRKPTLPFRSAASSYIIARARYGNLTTLFSVEILGFWCCGEFLSCASLLPNLLASAKKMSNLERSNVLIREVWKDNLDYEFALIRVVVDKYPYVAMDTEFPGVVLRPVGNFRTPNEFHYQTLKANVDLMKLIQLGLTFADEKGNLPTCGTEKYCVWQFNFCEFDPNEDVHANDSVELLSQCGIDFRKNNEKGVSAVRFGELLMSSGVVLNEEVQWITFHSAYDFGYLVKLLSGKNLPDTEAEFLDVIKLFFPILYDIKYMMKFCGNLHGGLNRVAELLGVKRIGISHQAGSDSLLTCCTFMKLIEVYFDGSPQNHAGVLFGLGVDGGQNAY